jgi:hypothetical protein|eukprot:g4126.t1
MEFTYQVDKDVHGTDEQAIMAGRYHERAEQFARRRHKQRQGKVQEVVWEEKKSRDNYHMRILKQQEARDMQNYESLYTKELLTRRRLARIEEQRKHKIFLKKKHAKEIRDKVRNRRIEEAEYEAQRIRKKLDDEWKLVNNTLRNPNRQLDDDSTVLSTAPSEERVARRAKRNSQEHEYTQRFRSDIHKAIRKEHHDREKDRTKYAGQMIQDHSAATCFGHTSVAKGLGTELLARVNQVGTFKVPTNLDDADALPTELIDNLKIKNVAHRRKIRDHHYHGKAWNDHVTSLGTTPSEKLLQKKYEYEERRQWLRMHMLKEKSARKKAPPKKNVYIPKSMASQHAIQLGMPHNKRQEYDERRAFLRSHLTAEEKFKLAKQRGDA